MYDESFNDSTILGVSYFASALEEASETVWDDTDNDYANSKIHAWLNNTYIDTIDADTRALIKLVKVPYRPRPGTSTTVNSGTSGLSCKVFLLSAREVGSGDRPYFPVDGATLSYYKGIESISTAEIRKNQAPSGENFSWWLRSPYCSNDRTVCVVNGHNGTISYYDVSTHIYFRLAIVLPNTTTVLDNRTLVGNTAPSLPGTITLPSTIYGGRSTPISWGASTDAEGDAVNYKLERQLNNGTWTQIYQFPGTYITDTVPFGTSTVRYRVKAYDAEGLESDWQTSATKTVVNNTAPTTPGTPNIPATVVGGNSITITWGASSDAQNNAISYYLYRSVNGGSSWLSVYNGSALSFADTIPKGTPSVTYRVRAYDGTDYSSYAVSETRTVDNTVPPEIAANDEVTVADGFSWNYTVTQPDGEETTVTEAIDGKTHRTYTATLDEQNTFSVTGRDFMTLLNGSHTLSVTATSSGGKSASRSAAVTKAVHEASVTLTNPLPADALITRMVMSVTGYIPPDADYQVLATNNANDDSPVWEDITSAVRGAKKFFFTNTTAENGSAFNFWLTARRGNAGGYISLIGGAFE